MVLRGDGLGYFSGWSTSPTLDRILTRAGPACEPARTGSASPVTAWQTPGYDGVFVGGERYMSKDRKLRRYRRKDYSEIVDFPVEIVGRDGLVRRYDFEASIRLYQRRMSFAAARFHDSDLVAAEQGHCRARIEQLRRSFFQLYGWGTPEGSSGPETSHPEHAGELAGFLVRVFRSSERLSVGFERVESGEGPTEVWYLRRSNGASGLLVYSFAFDRADGDDVRKAYFELMAGLRGIDRILGDAERLIAYHQTADCGFVMTGRADDVTDLAAVAPDEAGPMEVAPTPWDEVRDFVRRGDFPTAFLRCRWILEGQPWHRDAYAVGSMLGVVLRRSSDAEDMAFMGTRYFPRDGLLFYYLGLARLHQGRRGAAVEALRSALALDPMLVIARSLLTLSLVESGRYLEALRQARGPGTKGTTAEATTHAHLVRTLFWLLVFAAVSCVALGLSVLAVVRLGKAALLVLFLVIALVLLGAGAFRQRVEEVGRRLRYEDLQLAMRRIQRRRVEPVQA